MCTEFFKGASSRQNLGIESAPHLHGSMTTPKLMLLTSAALLPVLGVYLYFYGFGVIWQLLIAGGTAFAAELLTALLRLRRLKSALGDYSWLVYALILALTVPPLLPWYQTVFCTLFAILLVKEAFGGLGMNIFNPAMSGFVFLIISAPAALSGSWITPAPAAITAAGPQATMEVIFEGSSSSELYKSLRTLRTAAEDEYQQKLAAVEAEIEAEASASPAAGTEAALNANDLPEARAATAAATATAPAFPEASGSSPDAPHAADALSGATTDGTSGATDALSGATWLYEAKIARKADDGSIFTPPDYFTPAYQVYLWTAGACLAGGILLICLHIIMARMVFCFFAAMLLFSWAGGYFRPEIFYQPAEQLLLGGTMLAGFFIITDPVTNAGTARGRICFAILCAFLIIILRAFGSYSDAVAFSVMLCNAAAPLIDVLTRRRTFGAKYEKGEPNERKGS